MFDNEKIMKHKNTCCFWGLEWDYGEKTAIFLESVKKGWALLTMKVNR
jgi:hypothetical protein